MAEPSMVTPHLFHLGSALNGMQRILKNNFAVIAQVQINNMAPEQIIHGRQGFVASFLGKEIHFVKDL